MNSTIQPTNAETDKLIPSLSSQTFRPKILKFCLASSTKSRNKFHYVSIAISMQENSYPNYEIHIHDLTFILSIDHLL